VFPTGDVVPVPASRPSVTVTGEASGYAFQNRITT
jgi:hypothetical protein